MDDEPVRVSLELLAQGLGQGGVAELTVSGGCMAPLVSSGDRVEVVVARGRPRAGDLVVARDDLGGVVCHRVLGGSPSSVRLAGDRSAGATEHALADVLGTVRSVTRDSMRLDLEAWLVRAGARAMVSVQQAVLGRGEEPARGRRLSPPMRALRRFLIAVHGVIWVVSAALVEQAGSRRDDRRG